MIKKPITHQTFLAILAAATAATAGGKVVEDEFGTDTELGKIRIHDSTVMDMQVIVVGDRICIRHVEGRCWLEVS